MADLVTLEQYKLYLSRSFHNASKENENDIYLSNILLPGASKAIRSYFDNDFQSISRTETFSIEQPTSKIFPQYKPIASITSLTISDTLIPSTSYSLLKEQSAVVLSSDTNISGLITSLNCFPRGYNNVVLVYVGGYELDRGDQYTLCKLIAKIDEADTKTFSNVDSAEETFFDALTSDSSFMQMLNAQFRNYRL